MQGFAFRFVLLALFASALLQMQFRALDRIAEGEGLATFFLFSLLCVAIYAFLLMTPLSLVIKRKLFKNSVPVALKDSQLNNETLLLAFFEGAIDGYVKKGSKDAQ